MNIASYKIRIIAKAIDIVFIVLLYVLTAFLGGLLSALLLVVLPVLGFYRVNEYLLYIDIIGYSTEVLVFSAYFSFFVSKYEGTIGKKICRIKIVAVQGKKLTPYRAFGRFLAELLSASLLCLGYIVAIFDPEKRTLHDRICSTRVVIVEKNK